VVEEAAAYAGPLAFYIPNPLRRARRQSTFVV
jgi:hypothetical protein